MSEYHAKCFKVWNLQTDAICSKIGVSSSSSSMELDEGCWGGLWARLGCVRAHAKGQSSTALHAIHAMPVPWAKFSTSWHCAHRPVLHTGSSTGPDRASSHPWAPEPVCVCPVPVPHTRCRTSTRVVCTACSAGGQHRSYVIPPAFSGNQNSQASVRKLD